MNSYRAALFAAIFVIFTFALRVSARGGTLNGAVVSVAAGVSHSDQEEKMINVLENIPYKEAGMGNRKLVDEKHVMIMQIALKPGQSVPLHTANSNVHLLVIKGEVAVNLNGVESAAKEGSLIPIAYKTKMTVANRSGKDAAFLNIKTPNPSEMGE